MPTDKPRITFTLSQEKLDEIDSYRFENKIKNQSQAILSLISKGMADYLSETKEATPDADPLRTTLLQNFDQLNREGRERLVETSDDMVSSGKYIKSGPTKLGSEKMA